jgi:hypothetical protein
VAAELNTRYVLNIRFDFGSVTLDAEFVDTSAATVIKALLPINATVVTWDGGLYFQIGPRVTRLSGARTEVALGEIAYCPDTGAIAIAFRSKPMPADPETGQERPCNVWARALGDVRTLAAVKDGTEVKISGWLAPLKGGINGPARRHGRR